MPPPDDDSDEEWSRIADAVNDFEAQYVAARNAVLHTQRSAGSAPKGNVFTPLETTFAPPPHPYVDGPPPQPRDAIGATSILPNSSVTHPVPTTSLVNQPSAPLVLKDSANEVANVANIINGPMNSTTIGAATSAPMNEEHMKFDAIVAAPASDAVPNMSANPYSIALAQKEEEVRGLKQQLIGVQSNFQNKIRVLHNELLQTRRNSIAPTSSVPGSSSVPAATTITVTPSVPAIESVNRVEELQRETHRLRQEVEQARAESRAHSESLAFTQQELAEVRDRERKLVAALRAAPAPYDSPSTTTTPLANPTSPALPPVVLALTQPGDVVEGTQAAAGVATQAPAGLPTQMHGQVQSQLPVGMTTRPMSQVTRSQQPFNMHTALRPVSRKRRRPSTARSANDGTTDELKLEQPISIKSSADDKQVDGTRSKRAKIAEDKSLQQHGWGFDFNSDTWSENTLRRRLFEGRLGKELLSLATIGREELGSDLLAAMGNDARWPDVIPSLARILTVAPRATWTVLRIARVILTYCTTARAATALSAGTDDSFVAATIQAFNSATRRQDARIACLCMQVLNAVIDGVADISDSTAADATAASISSVILSSDSSLLWASGARNARQRETAVEDDVCCEESDDDDIGVANGKSVRTNALRLLDAATALTLVTNSPVPDSVWGVVERAYGEAADILCSGGDDERVEVAMGMMSRAAIHAPYLINDFGGADGLCSTCTRAVRWLQRASVERVQEDSDDVEGADDCSTAERAYAMGVVCASVNNLLLAAAGMGNKLDITPPMQLIGLSTLAILAWPRKGLGATPPEFESDSRFQIECRKAWIMINGTSNSRKTTASLSHNKSAVD